MKQYLNERQVSALTGRAVQSLRNDRCIRRGFPYLRLGSSIKYDYDDVIAYMERCKINVELEDNANV